MSLFKILMITSFILTAHSALAFSVGTEGGNGGDLCEDRIKVIRDDFSSWIHQGGSTTLVLPAGLLPRDYDSKMTSSFQKASISCTTDTLKIGEAEKTCVNFPNANPPRLVCNFARFQSTPQTDQYILIHHEYAGLSGFETNTGESSTYGISNQIANYLVNETVKKLTVKPTGSGEPSLVCDVTKYVQDQPSVCGSVTLTNAHAYQVGIGACPDLAMDIRVDGSRWIILGGRATMDDRLINWSNESSQISFQNSPAANFEISTNLSDGSQASFSCHTENWFAAVPR